MVPRYINIYNFMNVGRGDIIVFLMVLYIFTCRLRTKSRNGPVKLAIGMSASTLTVSLVPISISSTLALASSGKLF